jgi:hypothetical protein
MLYWRWLDPAMAVRPEQVDPTPQRGSENQRGTEATNLQHSARKSA